MGMTIELGWWILPLSLTVVVFSFAFLLMLWEEPDTGVAINRVINAFLLSLASVASLAFWLVWALVLK